jgi:CubicO group peptidase (beta-lactamase class C family)
MPAVSAAPSDMQGRLTGLVQAFGVTGASVALLRNGATELAAAGVRDAGSGEPVDTGTVFDAASLSKPMVAYAVLQLAESGLLDLDEPLSHRIRPVVPDDPAAALITARHVLSHTCGLQNVLDRGERLRIHFPPGAWFSYSSAGFGYLQAALEAQTGEPLEATMQRLVFEPLGMRSSSFVWQERFAGRAASPHENGVRMDKHRPQLAGASYSLQTTAGDYAAFLSAVLHRGRQGAPAWRQCLAPVAHVPRGSALHLEATPPDTHEGVAWGLGWGLEPRQGTFFQWGKMNGVRAFAMGHPGRQCAVVLLSNSNTGLRLMAAIAGEALPGHHPAIDWLRACVTE